MYCYKCGVKLKESEKRCPLCHTYLKYAKDSDELAAYSNIVDDVGRHVDFKYLSRILLFVLLLSALITVICDYCISGEITWSVYVIVSTIYLATQVSFLYFEKKLIPAILNLLGLECLLFTIAFFTDGLNWYLYLVMPNIFAVWLLIVLSVYTFKRKKRNLMRTVPIILFVMSSILIVTEILIDLYTRKQIELVWSIYASIPIVVLGLIILVASFNKKLVDEIKKRIFI